MKFKGQVKIPELDSPGVPAVILIEDPQTELFVEGESLGRWSLADVRAERLIASAFSLNLDGDEVTFIADDPINFAYGGVDEMAKVWARYKTMTMPRRMVATSRSRKGTKPSRIGDLRSAIEETLSGPAPAPARPPVHRPVIEVKSDPDPAPTVEAPEAVREPGTDSEPAADPGVPETVETETVETEASPAPAAGAESSPPLVERSSLVEEMPTDIGSDEEMLQPPAPQTAPRPPIQESVFKDVVPWAEQPRDTDQVAAASTEEPVEPDPVVVEPAQPVKEAPIAESVTAAINEDRPAAGSEFDSDDQIEDRTGDDADESVPWLEPPTAEPVAPPRHAEPVAKSEPPASPEQPRYVVDLGAFEQTAPAVVRTEPTPADDPDDMVLEPAMAGTGEKGGLMGAVRSAFVRNRDVHDHEYVAAPGGIGIVRNICTHCGHISIGVAE